MWEAFPRSWVAGTIPFGQYLKAVLCEGVAMTTGNRSAVFIHGLWLHATSWSPWLELFRESVTSP